MNTPQDKLKRLLWNAFQASSAVGMGFLHAPDAKKQTEDSLYQAVNRDGKNEFYTDYVFGRMMKTKFSVDDAGNLKVSPEEPRLDYQSWGATYRSGAELIASVG